jgi:hypothetical protein
MRHILVVTDRVAPDRRLVEALAVLFPGCPVAVVPPAAEPAEAQARASAAAPLTAPT